MDIIYPERESKNLEFKASLPHFKNLIKTCVAFANGSGGKIIIGVEDKTRKLIGIDEETRDRVYDEFPNSIYDAVSPSLLVEIYEKNFETKTQAKSKSKNLSVMIIDVSPSHKKPVFIKSEGMPGGVYLRAGSNTRKASPELIEELMRQNKRIYFDEESLGEEIKILSQDLLTHIFGRVILTRLLAEKVVDEKKHPTVAGVLAFCETPHLYIPEAMVQCTYFEGTEGREIIQTQEIYGCLEQQITSSFLLVKSWLSRKYQLKTVKLESQTLIPEAALREAISNALLHRKYTIPGAVKIALYENRLEIFSPGNFPGLVDVNHLGDGTTYLRNPHLVRLARRFGLVEKLGTGIRLIFETCQQAGLKKPEFIEGSDSVKLIFYFALSGENFDSEEESLLSLFQMREEIKIEHVQEHLGVSRNTATRKLGCLLNNGLVRRIGKGPSVRYVRVS